MSNVSVPVIVDDILEEDEEFDLTLSIPSSLGPAITAGDRDMATAIITDSISKFSYVLSLNSKQPTNLIVPLLYESEYVLIVHICKMLSSLRHNYTTYVVLSMYIRM